MPENKDTFKVASFNVQNLFGRAKIFNFRDHDIGDKIMEQIDRFRDLLKEKTYTNAIKKEIVKLYTGDLKPYIEVLEDRRKLFKRKGWAIVGVAAKGEPDWDGTIRYKQAKFSDIGREYTAKVIKKVDADVLCIVEAENRDTLNSFDAHLLKNLYKYEMLIDGNDPRGIDVGLYSKYPIGGVWTHIFDMATAKSKMFSRDCLEVEVLLPDKQPLYVLCNHLKSRGYDYDNTSNMKRKRQATRVAEILKEKYDLKKDWVVVAGDFNDNPESAPLQPLLKVNNLYDVLEQKIAEPKKRWTYYYKKLEQIDFILVSKPLLDRLETAGVERRGIYKLEERTTADGEVDIEHEFDKDIPERDAASDHGAVWATFKL